MKLFDLIMKNWKWGTYLISILLVFIVNTIFILIFSMIPKYYDWATVINSWLIYFIKKNLYSLYFEGKIFLIQEKNRYHLKITQLRALYTRQWTPLSLSNISLQDAKAFLSSFYSFGCLLPSFLSAFHFQTYLQGSLLIRFQSGCFMSVYFSIPDEG